MIVIPDGLLKELERTGNDTHVLICEHVHDGDYTEGPLLWQPSGEDGTSGRVQFLMVCEPCTKASSIKLVEYFWHSGKFHCCDTHAIAHQHGTANGKPTKGSANAGGKTKA